MNGLKTFVDHSLKKNGDKVFLHNANVVYSYEQTHSIVRTIQKDLNSFLTDFQTIGILHSSKLQGIVACLSACLSNHTYIPLDNQAPIKRNLQIIKQNNLSALIICNNLYNSHSKLLSESFIKQKISLDELDALLLIFITEEKEANEDIPYILFTSGSSGRPKGIKITSKNALAFIHWANDLLPNNHTLNFCSIAPLQFDLSVFDLYVSLLNGGSLFVFENEDIKNPRYVTQVIDEMSIQVIYSTPTLYSLLFRFGKMEKRSLSSLRVVIFAGEVMPYSTLEQLQTKCLKAMFYNFYGPTETNVCLYFDSTHYLSEERNDIPIGIPCPYAAVKIKEKGLNGIGELWVSGETVFNGYMNNDLNQKALTIYENEIWYKTGDLVKKDADGFYHFVSRNDRMVKHKGYRIELKEIENVIRDFDLVKNCAVIYKLSNNYEGQIIAFLEMTNNNKHQESKIRELCRSNLPHYMIPHFFNTIDQFPLNSNSKIDYKKLSQW